MRFSPTTVTCCLPMLKQHRCSKRSDGGQAAEHWDSLVLEGADPNTHKLSSEHPSAAQMEVRDVGRPSAEAAAAAAPPHHQIEKYTPEKFPS